MAPPPPLSCGICGRVPAPLRLVDLEAESALTGRPAAAPFGWVQRCAGCWDAYRKARAQGRPR